MPAASPTPVSRDSESQRLQPKRLNHKEHHIAVIRSAKKKLIGTFISMRCLDAVAFFGTGFITSRKLLCALGLLGLWTTPFLVAIWKRQAWAVYLFSVFIFLAVFAAGIGFIHLVSQEAQTVATLSPFLVTAGGYLIIACLLLYSKDVKRLISRAYN